VGGAAAHRQFRLGRHDLDLLGGAGGRRRVCDVGLWRWSRHPNYFFEWFGWLAHPVIAISTDHPLQYALQYPWGWAALLAPVFMYWIPVRVTGIPPLEAQMLRSRGERYRDDQLRAACSFRCHRKHDPDPEGRVSAKWAPVFGKDHA
jgi:steroid 5-alpha reductase family enzyme